MPTSAASWMLLLTLVQSGHVSFLVMGKTSNHRQAEAELHLLNYHFFAEIFVRSGGSVTEASLVFPSDERQAFEDLGFVQEVHGGRYDEEAELDRLYPNGDYAFRFSTPDGEVNRVLAVRGTGEGTSRIPTPVRIWLEQGGKSVSPNAVDPDEDLTVAWSDFSAGRSDPNGIVDDLVFVVAADCHGERIEHSGRPFEGTPYLGYTAKDYTIPRATLSPGEPHQLYVEHAIVDTSEEDGIVGLVTYAATTFLDFRTTGRSARAPCPDVMFQFDGGQTDRPSR